MPGCAAIGCNNRSEKGYSMKCFPRDPLLRQEWKERVGRANWEPSKNSFLCHDHFAPDQWVESENGKSRLKKDAMPSIFKETSTRKSPKKQRLKTGALTSDSLGDAAQDSAMKASDNESEENNYTLEYLDDCEYKISFAPEEIGAKNSQQQIISGGKSSNTSSSRLPTLLTKTSIKQKPIADGSSKYERAYHIVSEKDMSRLEKENIIIVSDENNREIGKLIQNNESIIIVADEDNKEIGQIVVENNLLDQCNSGGDIKLLDKNQGADYDDIEEKLKKICSGEDIHVSLIKRRDSGDPGDAAGGEISHKNETLTSEKTNAEAANRTRESKIEKDISGMVKIIFGTESGDDTKPPSDAFSFSQVYSPKVSGHPSDAGLPLKSFEHRNAVKKKDNKSVSLNESLRKREASDVPTIRAAMQRQKRTKGDVMKSIEKAIAELSERTLQSVDNDQLTRSILRIARARKKGDREQGNGISRAYKRPFEIISDKFRLDECDSSSKKSKFTIKVTGVADDVSEIIEGLETTSGYASLQMNNSADTNSRKKMNEKGAKFVVAEEINVRDLIRIDSRFNVNLEHSTDSLRSEQDESSDCESVGFGEGSTVDGEFDREYGKRSRQQVSDIGTLFKRNKECIHTEEFRTKMRGKRLSMEENGRIGSGNPDSDMDNNQARLKYFSKSQDWSKELRQKINAQQEVIKKLTNQLIIYKGLEAKLANLNFQLQVKTKENQVLKEKLQTKPDVPTQEESNCQKDDDVKQKTISNLSNKVNQLKEANKKLMLKITCESQEKKLLHHLKQRDDQIKELNWKLKKASTFLDRAEKNANTYKRKMLSMQTSIRRQKASDEKQNHFKELLIDNAKHEFSESALLTAMDIKNSCGIKCYQKLLSYDFPLPSLRTLRRRFQKGNVTEDDWGDEDQEPLVKEGQESRTRTEVCVANETSVETEVTGTVQDIFEEINDAEDLNSSELGEHIFLQLKMDRKYGDA